MQKVKRVKAEIVAEQDRATAEAYRSAAAEQGRVLASIEQLINQVIEPMFKLLDACDNYLTDPDHPGEYRLDGIRADRAVQPSKRLRSG